MASFSGVPNLRSTLGYCGGPPPSGTKNRSGAQRRRGGQSRPVTGGQTKLWSVVAGIACECNYLLTMRTYEWGPIGDVGQLTPGTLFYVFLDGATHLAMKVEVAGDHEELSYYCAVLSPQWGGKNAPPCLIHEKTVSSLPLSSRCECRSYPI
jgi:hypothetical protein